MRVTRETDGGMSCRDHGLRPFQIRISGSQPDDSGLRLARIPDSDSSRAPEAYRLGVTIHRESRTVGSIELCDGVRRLMLCH